MEYTEKLNPLDCMIEEPDGRTIKGLNHNIDTTSKEPALANTCNNLTILKKDIAVAAIFREDIITTVTDEALSGGIKYFRVRYDPETWPKECNNLLLGRELGKMQSTACYYDMLKATNPFVVKVWDPAAPTIGGMPGLAEAAKLQTFQRIYFRETFMVLVAAGEAKSAIVCMLCRDGIEQFGLLDPLELSTGATNAIAAFNTVWKYFQFILLDSSGCELMDRYMI